MDFIDPLHRDFELKEIDMTFLEPPIPTAGEKRVFWTVVSFAVTSAVITLGFFGAKLLGLI